MASEAELATASTSAQRLGGANSWEGRPRTWPLLDFPMENGDFPMENGDFPIEHGDVP